MIKTSPWIDGASEKPNRTFFLSPKCLYPYKFRNNNNNLIRTVLVLAVIVHFNLALQPCSALLVLYCEAWPQPNISLFIYLHSHRFWPASVQFIQTITEPDTWKKAGAPKPAVFLFEWISKFKLIKCSFMHVSDCCGYTSHSSVHLDYTFTGLDVITQEPCIFIFYWGGRAFNKPLIYQHDGRMCCISKYCDQTIQMSNIWYMSESETLTMTIHTLELELLLSKWYNNI